MGNLSARAIASELGVSHTAVNKAASTGRIEREPDGGFDLEKVRASWNANVNIHQQARGAGNRRAEQQSDASGPAARPARAQCRPHDDDEDTDESKFSTAKIQRLIEVEKLAEKRRQNAKAAGELLDRADTLSALTQIGKMYTAARESLPTQLATKLVGKQDLDEIERIIRAELLEADIRICNEIDSRFPHLGSSNGIDSGIGQ